MPTGVSAESPLLQKMNSDLGTIAGLLRNFDMATVQFDNALRDRQFEAKQG